jgi:hypothetical protein
MATRDNQDPNNAPGDWWSQNAPTRGRVECADGATRTRTGLADYVWGTYQMYLAARRNPPCYQRLIRADRAAIAAARSANPGKGNWRILCAEGARQSRRRIP